MRIFLVRHGDAGSRRAWDSPDDRRPLSTKGWSRANQLVDVLSTEGIERLLSSPHTRCSQTLGPLAATLDLPVEETSALAEGASLAATLELIEELAKAGTTTALCSHGDVIPELLAGLSRRGTHVDPNGKCPKGSVWILTVSEGVVTSAIYAGSGDLPVG